MTNQLLASFGIALSSVAYMTFIAYYAPMIIKDINKQTPIGAFLFVISLYGPIALIYVLFKEVKNDD